MISYFFLELLLYYLVDPHPKKIKRAVELSLKMEEACSQVRLRNSALKVEKRFHVEVVGAASGCHFKLSTKYISIYLWYV